jgi:branched-chain amino acid transport system permease protein
VNRALFARVLRGSALLGVVALALTPVLASNRLWLSWGSVALLWGLWIVSFNIVWGFAGQLSLAQFALGGAAGYSVVILTTNHGYGLLLASLVSTAGAVLVSILLALAALRLRGFYFAILTVTFGTALVTVAVNWEVTGRSSGLIVSRDILPHLDVARVSWDMASPFGGLYGLLAAAFVICLLGSVLLARSPAGRAMMAVRDDEPLASSVGVNPFHTKVIAFAASTVVACVAGILSAFYYRLVVPEMFSLDHALTATLLLVLAGLGAKFSPLIAAAVYALLYEMSPYDQELQMVLLGATVIAMVLFFPRGLAGIFDGSSWRTTSRGSSELDVPNVVDASIDHVEGDRGTVHASMSGQGYAP